MTTENKKTTANNNNTDDELIAILRENGVQANKNWKRATSIHKLEELGLWRQLKASVVPDSYKTKYGPEQNCGDDIAHLLKGLDVHEVGTANGIDVEAKWGEGRRANGKSPLNPGMQRMNLGVVLRGRVRRGEYVVIDGEEFNVENKEDAA